MSDDVCKSCRAPVRWVTSAANLLPMPVDPDPAEGGNLRLTEGDDAKTYAHVVRPELRFGRRDLYRAHFATCPNAGTHRRRRHA